MTLPPTDRSAPLDWGLAGPGLDDSSGLALAPPSAATDPAWVAAASLGWLDEDERRAVVGGLEVIALRAAQRHDTELQSSVRALLRIVDGPCAGPGAIDGVVADPVAVTELLVGFLAGPPGDMPPEALAAAESFVLSTGQAHALALVAACRAVDALERGSHAAAVRASARAVAAIGRVSSASGACPAVVALVDAVEARVAGRVAGSSDDPVSAFRPRLRAWTDMAHSPLAPALSQLAVDVDGARMELAELVASLDRRGLHLRALEARLAWALHDPDRAPALFAEADAVTTVEPALVDAAWLAVPELEVQVVGGRAVRCGGDEYDLGSKGEQLFLALLVAEHESVHWETVAAWLWPDEVDPDKLKSRLTSMTNLTRKALGPQAWRLQREGTLLRVSRRRLTLDLDRMLIAAGDAATVPPPFDDRALLPGWNDLEWVDDARWRIRDRFDELIDGRSI